MVECKKNDCESNISGIRDAAQWPKSNPLDENLIHGGIICRMFVYPSSSLKPWDLVTRCKRFGQVELGRDDEMDPCTR